MMSKSVVMTKFLFSMEALSPHGGVYLLLSVVGFVGGGAISLYYFVVTDAVAVYLINHLIFVMYARYHKAYFARSCH